MAACILKYFCCLLFLTAHLISIFLWQQSKSNSPLFATYHLNPFPLASNYDDLQQPPNTNFTQLLQPTYPQTSQISSALQSLNAAQQNVGLIDRYWFMNDGGKYGCLKNKRLIRGNLARRFRKPVSRTNCNYVDKQDVQIIGIVVTHHKTGTVLRRGFYYTICAQAGINLAIFEDAPITMLQSTNNTEYWWNSDKDLQCKDYHPCNNKGIVHAKISIRQACVSLGIECADWYDLLCFINKCSKKLEIDEQIKIVNPVRNPIAMIMSSYQYHKGLSPENWANENSLQQLGFWHQDEGGDFYNDSLSHTLGTQNEKIGLEIVFRMMANDILDMTMLYLYSHTYDNIMNSRFEDCMNSFKSVMQQELQFFQFFGNDSTYKERDSVVRVGSWVQSDANVDQQQKLKHISSKRNSTELEVALREHKRYEQLRKLAVILGYKQYI
eukprot:TRINITY_DN14815_c1_g1_i1.p1 TRINITY_DN14815_c1_g1~~TRINITY_DN14815_c1_g1_i1.p1  ORF type:complete len:439 (+),score=23.06 TRINITY_DN14815_c1_g1_i1:103-1419(+)